MFWILLILFVALMIVFLIGVLELDQPTVIDEPVHIFDFTFKDDYSNTYVVTAAHTSDCVDLLHKDYGLPYFYITNYVFLVDSKKVF